MRVLKAIILAALILAMVVFGCAGVSSYKSSSTPPAKHFDGTFKGPLTQAYGPEAWGDAMKIDLHQQDKQGKGTFAFHGDATTYYGSNPWDFFKVTGQLDLQDHTKAQLSFLDIGREIIFKADATFNVSSGELLITFDVRRPPFHSSQIIKATMKRI